jgi:hypothetical protein
MFGVSVDPMHTSPRTSESLGRVSPYVVDACYLILAIMPILGGISAAIGCLGGTPVLEMVNRTGKGDRLPPLVPAFHRNAVDQPVETNFLQTAPDQELIDGCESLASPLTRSRLAQMAGRCLS